MPRVRTIDPAGYPRTVKLWGGYDPAVGLDFYARYDMIISEGFSEQQLLYLRTINPELLILYSGIGTYDVDTGLLGSQWIGAAPGTHEYECFYRGTNNEILRVDFWNHGMFNMGDDWCINAIANHLASGFSPQTYDGVFFDRITQVITPFILQGIDLDHDGRADDPEVVNAEYWKGTERFLDLVRQKLGEDLIIVANDAPLVYSPRLNGREYESMIRSILDGDTEWAWFRYNYEQWMLASLEPRLTMVMANPPLWMERKYGYRPYDGRMKPAMVREAASYYARMRFGLTTALMESGLYSYEFGTTWHGNAWWYEEFDAAGLGKGYLGSPMGEAKYALGPLMTPNAVQNPDFEEPGFVSWELVVAESQAALAADPTTAPFTTSISARLDISSAPRVDAVRLEQDGISLRDGQAYTLSFWGKATAPLWQVRTTMHGISDLGTLYGLDHTLEVGTAWQQFWIPFTATTSASAALSFSVGDDTGSIWIDRVSLQEGVLPMVFRRDFEHGVVLCNATRARRTISLGQRYRKIAGLQAPLVRIIIDDADDAGGSFTRIGGWAVHQASYDDWGSTYHHALTTADPTSFMSKAVWRADIPYSGQYVIYAWIAPHPEQDNMVTYHIRHAEGTAPVSVSPVLSEPNWISLGTYYLEAGAETTVTLINYSHAKWVIADAVKLESVTRYNDGTQVTSITLEGMDGIVLLNELPPKVYLPQVGRP